MLNYEENLSQSDFQEVTRLQTEDIHKHLLLQDEKIDKILEVLEGKQYENH